MSERAEVSIFVIARDQASKTFGTIGQTAAAFEKRMKGISTSMESVGKAASKAGTQLSLKLTAPIVALGATSVNAAMKSNRLRTALEGLAGGAEEAEAYVQGIKEASLGAVSSMDAMAMSTKALTLGVASNSAAMSELTEVAIVLGRAQGLDAASSVDYLTTAIGRQSKLILDNLGIMLDVSEVHELAAAHAHEYGMEVGKMSETQEWLVATLVKAKPLLEAMGGVVEDDATKWERARAEWDDARVALGQSLMPIMTQLAGVITNVSRAFSGFDEGTKKVIVTLGLLAAAAGPVLKIFGGLTMGVGKLIGLGGRLIGGLGDVAAAMNLLRTGSTAAEVASLGLAGKMAVALPIVGALAAGYYAYTKAVEYGNLINDEADKLHGKMIEHLDEYAGTAENAKQVANEYAAAQERGRQAVDDLMKGYSYEDEALAALNLSHNELNRILFDASTRYGDYVAAMKMAGAESVIVSEARYEEAKATGELATGIEYAGMRLQELIALGRGQAVLDPEAIDESTAALLGFGEATEELKQAWTGMKFDTSSLWGLVDVTEENKEQMAELALRLGVTSQEEMDLANRANALIASFEAGEISAEELADALHQVQVEALKLSYANMDTVDSMTYLERQGVKVAANLRAAYAQLGEAKAGVAAAYDEAADAAISAGNRVAEQRERWEEQRVNDARRAALEIQIWEREQNEFVADNADKLSDELKGEFAERTKAAVAEANKIKEYDAKLAQDLLSAESDYQRKKADIMQIEDEEQRKAALAVLERENAERVDDLKKRAELERQIEEESRQKQIEAMREGGRAAGVAMAEAFLEESQKAYDEAQQAAEIHARNVQIAMAESLFDDARRGAQGLKEDIDDVGAAAEDAAKKTGGITVPGAGGMRQHGGSVRKGHMYIVGEAGPEPFVPWTDGYIYPHSQLQQMSNDNRVYQGDTVTINNELAAAMWMARRRQRRLERAELNM